MGACISLLSLKVHIKPNKFKKIRNVLPILYANKSYKNLNNVICNNQELAKVTHMMSYPDPARWLDSIHVKNDTVDPNGVVESNGDRPVIKLLTTKTHNFDEKLQKQLTS